MFRKVIKTILNIQPKKVNQLGIIMLVQNQEKRVKYGVMKKISYLKDIIQNMMLIPKQDQEEMGKNLYVTTIVVKFITLQITTIHF